jgi:NCS1 family nucleobase:cation symporter-1
MYVGHYLAWICAGVMGAAAALVLRKPLPQLDSGDVATQALGVSGALAVVAAGWTTANPTLYRAGLALQVVSPNWPRWVVTAIAGAITTLMACSPFVFTRLLDFVGVYGLLLMPVGAIVFVEHWIFPRIGWTRFWAARKGLMVSWPALVGWLGSVAAGVVAWQKGWIHLFFLAAPAWLLAAVVYTALAALAGARKVHAEEPAPSAPAAPAPRNVPAPVAPSLRRRGTKETAARLVTLATLLACLLLPFWVYVASPGEYASRLDAFKTATLVVTVVYFVAGVVWMNEREKRRGRAAGR